MPSGVMPVPMLWGLEAGRASAQVCAPGNGGGGRWKFATKTPQGRRVVANESAGTRVRPPRISAYFIILECFLCGCAYTLYS